MEFLQKNTITIILRDFFEITFRFYHIKSINPFLLCDGRTQIY